SAAGRRRPADRPARARGQPPRPADRLPARPDDPHRLRGGGAAAISVARVRRPEPDRVTAASWHEVNNWLLIKNASNQRLRQEKKVRRAVGRLTRQRPRGPMTPWTLPIYARCCEAAGPF